MLDLFSAGVIRQAASSAQSSKGAALIGFDMEDAQPFAPSISRSARAESRNGKPLALARLIAGLPLASALTLGLVSWHIETFMPCGHWSLGRPEQCRLGPFCGHKSGISEAALPGADVFIDQTHLRQGHLWQPNLFDAIAKCHPFLMLVSHRLGEWQKFEYYEALDRKVKNPAFVLLPVIIADRVKGSAANLPGNRAVALDREHGAHRVRSAGEDRGNASGPRDG